MPRTKRTARSWQAAKAKSAGVAKPVPRRSTLSTGAGAGASAEVVELAASADAATAELFDIGGALSRELHKATQESSRTFMRVRAASGAIDLEALPAVLDKLDEVQALVQRAYVKEKFDGEEFCDIWSRSLDSKLVLGIHEDEAEYDPTAEQHFTLDDTSGNVVEECTVTSSANGTIVDAAGYGILKIRGARESADWGTVLWEFTPSRGQTRDPSVVLREEGKEVVSCRQ